MPSWPAIPYIPQNHLQHHDHLNVKMPLFCAEEMRPPKRLRYDDAGSCNEKHVALANYGADIVPMTVVRGEGSYVYTASGQRILDWTSGQVGDA